MGKARKKYRRSGKTGLPPGSLVYVGNESGDSPLITLISGTEESVSSREVLDVKDLSDWPSWTGLNWINIDGIHNTGLVEELGRIFNIHTLVLEDIVNSEQRPKVEMYTDQVFLTMRMLDLAGADDMPEGEQFSMVLGPTYLLTFQERPGDVFDPVRRRLQNPESRIRTRGIDYLMYALCDLIVDRYFLILEGFGDELEASEEAFFQDQDQISLQHLQRMKRQLQAFRRMVAPLREAVGTLVRDEHPLISETTRRYLSDVYDHLIQVLEIQETHREFCVELRETHLSLLGYRTNEVMKVLTIIATIFIPLTFIVGVYGMNFQFMPELRWPWGYPIVWAVMLVCTMFMIRYFRRKKWL